MSITPPIESKNQSDNQQEISLQLANHARPQYIQTDFNPDDAVFERTERIIPQYSLPTEVKEAVLAMRQEVVEIPEVSEAGKYSTGKIRERFEEKTVHAQKQGKSWKLEYEWDLQKQRTVLKGSSVIMEEVKRGSFVDIVDSLRWSECFDRAIAIIRRKEVDMDPTLILHRATERKGVTASQREDIFEFVALYRLAMQDPELARDQLEKYFSSYYVVSSLALESRFEGDGEDRKQKITKKDVNNWRAACAIAIVRGMDESLAMRSFSIAAGDGEDNPQGKVREMVQEINQKGGDLSAIYGVNARIIGRIVMYEYMKDRQAQLEITGVSADQIYKRILAETIFMQLLTLIPEDEEASFVIALSDEELFSLVEEVFSSPNFRPIKGQNQKTQ